MNMECLGIRRKPVTGRSFCLGLVRPFEKESGRTVGDWSRVWAAQAMKGDVDLSCGSF